MDKTLYLECYSGISGDMTVAALLDLGADQRVLEKALASLPVDGFEIRISRVSKAGLDACDFDVILESGPEDHGAHLQNEKKNHGDGEGAHHPEHRGLSEIVEIIRRADITERSKDLAIRIFNILAEAESRAHGVGLEEVHFHEVGAIDSIVDIVSAAVCLDDLGITDVVVPVLNEGRGFVRCQHGLLPIPVPAVLNIAADHGLRLHIMDAEGEHVTPTGAAIVAAIRTSDRLPDRFSIQKIGIGAGKRASERPGVLRAMIISDGATGHDCIYKLECNIDDCTGEALGFAMERLLEAGARDVHYTPTFMKKNRPAYQLNVICSEEDIARMEGIIFEETTTIGIRRVRMDRTVLKREVLSIQTPLGEARVKVCDGISGKRFYPEYSSVLELCKKNDMPYVDVYRIVQDHCKAVNRER